MITAFLTVYALEIACGGTFVAGFSVYSYFKLKGKTNNYKIKYCDVSNVIKQYKTLDKRMNESIGGGKKGDKFFN